MSPYCVLPLLCSLLCSSLRVRIPKADGRERLLGIASLEDKIVQQAVLWVLQIIHEQDFLGFSYGFRPGRSQHNALDALSVAITSKRVNWILDADVEGIFDTIDHDWLIRFLEHRIGDPRILRLIRKWLTAGVSEDGKWFKTPVGTPQGSVISPLLANVYLHYVFDLWIAWWRKQRQGDVVIGFDQPRWTFILCDHENVVLAGDYEVLAASAQNLFHDVSVDVGQTPLDAVVIESEFFMVDAQQVQNCRVHVVGGYRVFDG